MGIRHHDGYSADVKGMLVVDDAGYRLAKTNGTAFVLAEACVAVPGTIGEIRVIVDGDENCRSVELPEGITPGQTKVRYNVIAPF
jgi:hypothetical protein